MKHEYKAFFLSEHIDEQIDLYIGQQQDVAESASTPANTVNEDVSQQAIQALQNHFASPKEDDPARLQRVWQRLEPQRAALEKQIVDTEKDIPVLIADVQLTLRKRMFGKSAQTPSSYEPSNFGKLITHQSRFSRLNVIIAVACTIILLIGGIVGLQILRQGKNLLGSAASIKETASIYDVTLSGDAYRLDPVTHKVLWHDSIYPFLGAGITSISVKNGLFYAFNTGNDGSALYAVNLSDGLTRWSRATEADVSISSMSPNPIITNNAVYFSEFSASEGYSMVYALSATTGNEIWHYRLNDTGILGTNTSNSDVSQGLVLQAATNDVLYATTYTGSANQPKTTLYALDIKHQGQKLWSKTIITSSEPDHGGVIINGVLCLSSTYTNDGKAIYGYDAITGTQKWSMPIGGEVYHLVAANGVLYIGIGLNFTLQKNLASGVYALRPQDGSILWHYANQRVAADPIIKSGTAYFVSSDATVSNLTLTALDATTGQLRWSQPVTGGLYGMVASNHFLYLPFNGEVKVFHLQDGSYADSFSVPQMQPFDTPFTLTIVP